MRDLLARINVDRLNIKITFSKFITQKTNIFVLTQTQYKLTDQIHGNVCSHALGLWKQLLELMSNSFKNSWMSFRVHFSIVYTYEVHTQENPFGSQGNYISCN